MGGERGTITMTVENAVFGSGGQWLLQTWFLINSHLLSVELMARYSHNPASRSVHLCHVPPSTHSTTLLTHYTITPAEAGGEQACPQNVPAMQHATNLHACRSWGVCSLADRRRGRVAATRQNAHAREADYAQEAAGARRPCPKCPAAIL